MERPIQQIKLVHTQKPENKNINDFLQWLGTSLGLFSLRDKDKSQFRIFIELLKAAKAKQTLTSEEIGAKLKLSRGTTVHHLNKLIESKLVKEQSHRYSLRVRNLSYLIEELERDSQRIFEDLKKGASELDKWLGMK